jgi:hypothetical protein
MYSIGPQKKFSLQNLIKVKVPPALPLYIFEKKNEGKLFYVNHSNEKQAKK